MYRRFLSLILACVLTFSMLTGCSSDIQEDKKTEATKKESGEGVGNEDSVDESDEEEETTKKEDAEEYLMIYESTICDRELQDFFQLYLGCWCDYWLQDSLKKGAEPINITGMLDHTGIVGAFTLNEGMRIVEDYSDSNFTGLNRQPIINVKSDVTYFTSVTNLQSNFDISYKYKKGTDAELKFIVKVTYKLVTTREYTDERMYAVTLVNNESKPDEWLIKEIYEAYESDNEYRIKKSSGSNSLDWNYWAGDNLLNEDVVPITEDDEWYHFIGVYKTYIKNNVAVSDGSSYSFIFLNDDDIPDLLVDINNGYSTLVLIYQDGEIYESEAYHRNLDFYYKEYEGIAVGHSWMYEECTDTAYKLDGNVLVETASGFRLEDGSEYKLNDNKCTEKEYNSCFDTSDMKYAWENIGTSIEEAFGYVRDKAVLDEDTANVSSMSQIELEQYKTEKNVIPAFKQWLQDNQDWTSKGNDFQYVLADIDNDTIPELFVDNVGTGENTVLLIYSDGKVYSSQLPNTFELRYKDNKIHAVYTEEEAEGDEYTHYYCYEVVDYVAELVASGVMHWDPDARAYDYTMDGESCSDTEFYYLEKYGVGKESVWSIEDAIFGFDNLENAYHDYCEGCYGWSTDD